MIVKVSDIEWMKGMVTRQTPPIHSWIWLWQWKVNFWWWTDSFLPGCGGPLKNVIFSKTNCNFGDNFHICCSGNYYNLIHIGNRTNLQCINGLHKHKMRIENELVLCGYGVGGWIASGFWKLPRRVLEASIHGIHLHSLVLIVFSVPFHVSLVLKVSVFVVTHRNRKLAVPVLWMLHWRDWAERVWLWDEGTEPRSACSQMAITRTKWTCGAWAAYYLKLSASSPFFQVLLSSFPPPHDSIPCWGSNALGVPYH